MSSEELTPLEASILVAVSKGLTDERHLATLMGVDVEEVRRVIERLIAKGYLRIEEKRFLFIKRKRIVLTEKGYNVLPRAVEIVKRIAEALREAEEKRIRSREELEEYIGMPYAEISMVTPLLLWMGLLPTLTLLEAAAFSELIEAETEAEEYSHEHEV